MSYQRQRDNREDEAFREIGKLILYITLFAFIAVYLVSLYATKMLFFLVNQLTDGMIDREEATGLLISGTLFAGVSVVGLLPLAREAGFPPGESAVWLGLGGLLWGLAIGFNVTLLYWSEVEPELESRDFTQVLGLPQDLYTPQPVLTDSTLASSELTMEEIEQLFVQPETQPSVSAATGGNYDLYP